MNAKEARELALWNKLPEVLKTQIKRDVKYGRFKSSFYKSPKYLGDFNWDNLSTYISSLEFLGYKTEIHVFPAPDNDEVFVVSWSQI